MGRTRGLTGDWDEYFAVDLGHEPVPARALEGVDALFHLAGRAHSVADPRRGWEMYRQDNLESTRALLANAKSSGVRCVVFVSSVKAGDANPLDPPYKDPYAHSKRLAEQAVLEGDCVAHPVVVRPALVYGPEPKGYLRLMIKAVRSGWFPPLPEVGNARSMVHRDDLARALIAVATDDRARGRTYVVTDGHPYSTREIYETILSALGRRAPSWSLPLAPLRLAARVGDLGERLTGRRWPLDSELLDKVLGSAFYDGTAIERELGFRARLRLADAIEEMVATTD